MRDPRVWAQRFGGACKLGFLVLVACCMALWLSKLVRGQESLLFWTMVGGAALSVGLDELGRWLAWRLGPLARLILLGALGCADLLGAFALVSIIAQRLFGGS